MGSLYPEKQMFMKTFAVGARNKPLNVYIKYNPFTIFPTGLSKEGLNILGEVADRIGNDSNATKLKHSNGDIVANLLDATLTEYIVKISDTKLSYVRYTSMRL